MTKTHQVADDQLDYDVVRKKLLSIVRRALTTSWQQGWSSSPTSAADMRQSSMMLPGRNSRTSSPSSTLSSTSPKPCRLYIENRDPQSDIDLAKDITRFFNNQGSSAGDPKWIFPTPYSYLTGKSAKGDPSEKDCQRDASTNELFTRPNKAAETPPHQ